jgi:type VI secretion system ImpA family protein
MIRANDPELLHLDRLTSPIAGPNPCGEWLRYEGTYDRIREARREDDPGLPQGVWQTDLKRADWGAVEFLCSTALAERSKDLQLAAWLLEAWMQLDSFAGAARGLELAGLLCAAFWDDMYPALTPELDARLAPIRWINDRLSRRLRLLPLTQPQMSDIAAYTFADWEQVLRNPGGAASGPALTMAKFEQSVNLTPLDWLDRSLRAAEETVARVQALDELLDTKAGKQSPGLIRFRGEAESAAQLLAKFVDDARAKLPQPAPEPPPASLPAAAALPMTESAAPVRAQAAEPPVTAETEPPQDLQIQSRAHAYQLLHEIADFLAENDPHSPTPYLIRRAANWGDMPFDALLSELVRDRNGLSDLGQLLDLGVKAEQKR